MYFITIGAWVFSKYEINLFNYILESKLGNKLLGNVNKFKYLNNINNKLFVSLMVIFTILLVCSICIQILIGVELKLNLEDYIDVHNHINKAGLLVIFIKC